jgi:enoyl-[acyl-carrier-protein] reductase (NADH)
MRKKIDEYADKFMSDKDFAMNVENIDELINLITDYLKQIQDLNKLLSSINYSKMTAEKLKEKTERAYRLKRYKNMF